MGQGSRMKEKQKLGLRNMSRGPRLKDSRRRIWRTSFLIIFIGSLPACSFLTLDPSPLTLNPPPGMVLIPAGNFLMGSEPTDGIVGMQLGVDELPQRRQYLKAFFIDRYEVTNADYFGYVKATGGYIPATWNYAEHPRGRQGQQWPVGTPAPGEEDHPVSDTDWYDAKDYCAWAGKRLPMEAEWEKAARGPDGRHFPWGDEYTAENANTLESGLGWVRAVGSYPENVSPYGVYDMIGNVAEWVADWYHPYPGSRLVRDAFGKHPVLRGGSWATPVYPFARVAGRLPAEQLPKNERDANWHTGFDKGFRCAMELR